LRDGKALPGHADRGLPRATREMLAPAKVIVSLPLPLSLDVSLI
jgi:hypothetical protein